VIDSRISPDKQRPGQTVRPGRSLRWAAAAVIRLTMFGLPMMLLSIPLAGGPAVGTSKLVRAAAVVGVAGLLLAISSPWPDLAIAGFATVGLGLAVLLPVIFSTAGHSGGDSSATALAKVNTFTYAGALAGPAVIGWSSDAIGLRATMAAVLVLLIAALSVGLPRLSPSSRGLSCD
jgi:hypothetical protein